MLSTDAALARSWPGTLRRVAHGGASVRGRLNGVPGVSNGIRAVTAVSTSRAWSAGPAFRRGLDEARRRSLRDLSSRRSSHSRRRANLRRLEARARSALGRPRLHGCRPRFDVALPRTADAGARPSAPPSRITRA